MNSTSPAAEPKPPITQAPRLLDQVVSNAEQNGHSHDAAVSMADCCRRYVLFMASAIRASWG
jgi:hypothetical protein